MLGMTSGADWLIAGLGNPEPKYDGTRHNAGFEALDYLAAQWHCDIAKAKWQGLYGTAQVGDHKVVLLKPLTYMNLSGQSIAPAANFYKIPADHVIVLCDDITQEPGHLRIRPHGSAGGHNGLKSIIASLGTEKFQPHPHWHRRQAQPAVRPGRLGAGQAAPCRPQGHDRPLPGH